MSNMDSTKISVSTLEIFQMLVEALKSQTGVHAVGLSGNLLPLPESGKGDFDVFIYCDEIPLDDERQKSLMGLNGYLADTELNRFENEVWGRSDFCKINGIDTWLMYFKSDDVEKNLDEILKGNYLKRADHYYFPIGRLGMFLNMTIFVDTKDFLLGIKNRLSIYPVNLRKMMIDYNLEGLSDTEDLERAAGRKDILFYHFALDLALDHFLLAIFAINGIYFPSRKRSLAYIEDFDLKPKRCSQRLLEVIRLGSEPTTIEQSYLNFRALCEDLKHYI